MALFADMRTKMALERKVKWALSSQLMAHGTKCIWWTLGHVTFILGCQYMYQVFPGSGFRKVG